MAAYSLDLRERIVDAVERGLGTRSKVASMFGVHESFVYKLLRQKRQRGDLACRSQKLHLSSYYDEDVYIRDYETAPQAIAGLGRYFKFYNGERLHQSLDYKTPEAVYRLTA
jgi:transposase-like protein